jgi:HK97 family phage prohead protease
MKLTQTTIANVIDISEANRTITSWITTPKADRSGDQVMPLGLANKGQYLKNPVVLWAHQRQTPPIGQCTSLEVQATGIIAQTKFSSTTALARDVFNLYREGTLRAWSIGFIPKSIRPKPRTQDYPAGLIYDAWELLEYSAVPVPDNPEALSLALKSGLIEEPKFWLFHDTGDIFAHLYQNAA